MHVECLGDYTLERKLGWGPFGEVFLAEHRFMKRPFVLKVLPEEVGTDASFARRFEEEVAAIANLDHPNIVKIHNVTCVDGRYFLVMDPVVDSFEETMHLDRYLAQKGHSLTEQDYIDILEQVAGALDAAHETLMKGRPLIHGGLKLTNILIAQSESGIKVLLCDFALTRLIGEGKSFVRICEKVATALLPENAHLHERGVQLCRNFVRAFSFLAPEQKTVEDLLLEPTTDTYSFGVLAYYLLARKMPEGCFELPSHLMPGSKLNWNWLISRCLKHNSAERPRHLTEALKQSLLIPQIETRDALTLSQLEEKIEHAMQIPLPFTAREEKETIAAPAPKPMLKPGEILRPEYESDPGAIFHQPMNVSQYVPKKVEIKEVEPLLTEMRVIAQGTYTRGSNEGARDEMPRHAITLSSFAMDIHPVTNDQFVRFLQAMGGEKDSNNNDIIRLRDSRIKRSAGKLLIESGYAKHPVVGVTWYGALAYAKWIGKRLPTEAEWEAASTGGHDNCLFPTGSTIERQQANFFSSDTTPVMSYPANDVGLFDMPGNVYEWCQDWYAYNYYDSSALEPENPKGPLQGVYRVLRGGCWKSLKEDLRCSHRHRNNPGAVNGTYGFRCAADVE